MRIKSLHIHNFRALASLDLEDLPDSGVVLISGENEKGKSTILEAVRTVLTVKSKSTSRAVKALKTIGGTEPPEVRLRAVVGDYEFELYKRFVNRATTSLEILAPAPASYSDSEAEDKLAEILAANLDPQLRDAMFITPEESGLGLKAAMIGSLTAALDERSGGDSGSDASGIIAAVEKEAARYYSPKNQSPTQELKAAEAAYAQAQAEREEAETKVAGLEEAVSSVEAYTLRKSQAEAELPQATQRCAAAAAELERATTASEEVARAAELLEQARLVEGIAREKLEDRRQRANALKSAEEELDALAPQVEEARARRDEERELVVGAKQELEAALDSQAKAKERRAQAAQALRLSQLAGELEEKRSLLRELSELVIPETELEEITQEQVAAIAKASQELEVATAVLEAQATSVTLRAASSTTVERDGEPLEVSDAQELLLTQPTTLSVGELSLEIRPGGAADESAVARAKANLEGLLDEAGCGSLEDAETRLTAWREHVAERRAVEVQRRGLLRDRSVEDIEREVEATEEQLAGHEEIPTVAEATERLADAEAALAEAEAAVSAAQAKASGFSEQPAAQKLARLEATLAAAQSGAERERSLLAEAEAAHPTEELENALAAAEEATAEKERAHAAAEEAARGSDLGLSQASFDAAQAKADSVRARVDDATAQLLRLEGVIKVAEGSAEELERAKATEEAARTRRDQVLRRAQAARLLLDTLLRHREEARQKYHAPFLAELEQLARPVFGGRTTFTLGDDLDVQTRTVDGATVPVSELSSGAREQLALLTRFAVARLVSSEGVPIFIDDQLGSTDELRLMHMGAVLRQLGATEQVLIFSCAPNRFDYIRDLDVREMRDIATY